MLIAIAAPDFPLAGLPDPVDVFMLLDGITSLPELIDVHRLSNRIYAVAEGVVIAVAMIEDLDLVFADQIQHSFPVSRRNRNAVSGH